MGMGGKSVAKWMIEKEIKRGEGRASTAVCSKREGRGAGSNK